MAEEKIVTKIDDVLSFLNKLSEIGKKKKVLKFEEEKLELVLETLNSEDEGKIFVNTSKYDGSEYFSKHKRESLVYSLSSINGKSFKEYERIEDIEERKKIKEDTINKIRDVVDKWNDNFVDYLYSKFSELIDESEEELVKKGFMKRVEVTEEKTAEK